MMDLLTARFLNLCVRVRPVILICATLTASPVQAGKAPSFDKVYASSNTAGLTEWGRRYEHGEGVKRDVDRAIRLYCKAAKKGDAAAQYYLGYLYAHGRGVKRDDALAAAWFLKAARQKDRQAEHMLRVMRTKPKARAVCVLSNGGSPGTKRKLSTVPAKGPIADLVRKLAPEYRLDPNLVLTVVEVESNFNPNAQSHKNAQGLMQLIPATAERFGVDDVWDPEQNLRGGMAYLRWLLDHFENDIELALAGYNAGEQAVSRHQGIPPYNETRDYVSRISRRLNL